MQNKTAPVKVCPTLAELLAKPGVSVQIKPWSK